MQVLLSIHYELYSTYSINVLRVGDTESLSDYQVFFYNLDFSSDNSF